ncbi:tRNA(Ile)-lysidine synthase [Geobacter sp. OR-1]|uniref:tRNA lysidine(34) synthetase TilS n=1 Tax=Geobacter sp. OR-1 TaxID=1266765 RepID=UPI000542E9A2|nr:tRNA lysidine(34) synthetase TilS [Geobacter sp. OR-1]GAM11358.1 tRNA(Ile)-lysidine synthase [Geobacter sp. OR-1]
MNARNHTMLRGADRTIREHGLFQPGQTVVVAVSGGVDSVVLLDYLAARRDLALSLVVAHLNHSLRGEESDADEAFVRGLAGRHGFIFESARVDVTSLAREGRLSLEEAGREARYRFLSQVAEQAGADVIALAHHADDQAETVLMRLIRGSGPAGLAGMAPRSADGRYVRPLLEVSRREIEAYARQQSLFFRTDSSNADPAFLRNRIRLELLPLLKGYNPAIVERLADTAAIMSADEALLTAAIERRWREAGSVSGSQVLLDLTVLSGDLPGMRLRLYRHGISRVAGNLRRISFRHLQSVDRLAIEGPPNGTLDLPGGLRVVRCYNRLSFSLSGWAESVPEYAITIPAAGCFEIPGGGTVSVEYCDGPPAAESGALEMLVDLAEFPLPWVVRGFLPGDRIAPRGLNGHKKVKEIFIDAKIPRSLRARIPLFFSGERLFWVAGLRKGGIGTHLEQDSRRARVRLLEFAPDTAMLA